MVNQRLKQIRLARGLSMEDLVAKMGGVVTKQSISKYENGKAKPSNTILNKLAAALEVKSVYLWSTPTINVEFIAYRKGSGLLIREQKKVECLVKHKLEECVELQELTQQFYDSDIPVQGFSIKKIEDVDKAAMDLRKRWEIGLDPIASIVGVLEDHFIYVFEIKANKKFDGISAVGYDNDKNVVASAVVSRLGVTRERQRFSLAHELGHLILKVCPNLDEEKAAHRFASVFLAPKEIIFKEVGNKRKLIQTTELFMLKQRLGMSIQAILYRLHDLNVITDTYYKKWCIDIARRGWRMQEPRDTEAEQPQLLERNVLRATSEGLLMPEKAKRILGRELEGIESPRSLIERRAFAKLPLEERRRLMAEQADKMQSFYANEMLGGDILEY
ncbi:MAG: helix-turn-helix domain-containing protein [Candidatus Anammoxibacter sp.]